MVKMTLVNRLSLFFLTALAVVLIGYSVVLFALARAHLSRQLDERSAALLDLLEAAADNEGGAFEWEGKERHLSLGDENNPDATLWAVF
ncbi:MAG TPA: hypothetical protein VGZ47_13005, partial [Gemmataceae bacterium]|nr:hypothetical protein [Gemmataceae bacterium]